MPSGKLTNVNCTFGPLLTMDSISFARPTGSAFIVSDFILDAISPKTLLN